MSATRWKVIVFKPWKSCITMPTAVLIGWFLGTTALIIREKQFLYCLTNTNVNLLYFPDSIEIVSLNGLTLWCSEINQSELPLHDFHGLKIMTTFHYVADIAYFWLAFTEIINFFSLCVTSETSSKHSWKLKKSKVAKFKKLQILNTA